MKPAVIVVTGVQNPAVNDGDTIAVIDQGMEALRKKSLVPLDTQQTLSDRQTGSGLVAGWRTGADPPGREPVPGCVV
jgi:hypothetical protein